MRYKENFNLHELNKDWKIKNKKKMRWPGIEHGTNRLEDSDADHYTTEACLLITSNILCNLDAL